MKAIFVIACLIGRVLSAEVEPVGVLPPVPVPQPQPPRAWLGLQVAKPDATIAAQLPSLPVGVGFVIRSIDERGPAKAAGLQELDVLWKMDDQMLVNEAQFATLLRLLKPRKEVTLSGFRAGKPLEVKLQLGDSPAMNRVFPGDLVDSAILPGACGGPMRVIHVADRLATYATDEGRAELQRDGEQYKVSIHGPKDALIYEGVLPKDGSLASIPEPWRRRIQALRRGLDHAMDGRMMSSQASRPRIVPPIVPNR